MAKSKKLAGIIYIALIALILIPFDKFGLPLITAPLALLLGLVFAFIFPNPYPKFNKKTSKYLLQVAVVCLGFNMNLQESLRSGSEGMMFRSNGSWGASRILAAYKPQDRISYFVRHGYLWRQRHSGSRSGGKGQRK